MSLSFLPNFQRFYCGQDEFVMANNSELVDITGFEWWTSESECIWKIIKNPKLDLEAFCTISEEFESDLFRLNSLIVYGNLKGCECTNVYITSETIPFYQNCTSLTGSYYGVLKITNVSDSDDLSGFLKLKEIKGYIEIFNTTLTNLSFLGNLQSVIGWTSNFYNNTRIYDNPNLTRLGWDSLKRVPPNVYPYQHFDLQRNHPDFCLTTYELQTFAENMVHFYPNLQAKICMDTKRKDGQKICTFENLSSLDPTCRHVIGNVSVTSVNEKEAWRLENVTNIYGMITVEGTEGITDLAFLKNLKTVATLSFKGVPLIRFLNNKKLLNVTLPKMKSTPFPYFDSGVIEINGNSLEIFPTRKECLLFQKQTKSWTKYNGFSCKKLPVAEGEISDGTDYEEEEEYVDGSGTTTEKPENGGIGKLEFRTILIVVFWKFLFK